MNVKRQFSDYITESNVPGSNKADSYIRAIGYANTMLKGFGGQFQNVGDIFSIDSVDQLKALHKFLLGETAKGDSSPLFKADVPPSYLKGNFCTAALRSLIGYRLAMARDAEILDILAQGEEPARIEKAFENPLPEPEFFLEGKVKPESERGAEELERLRRFQNRRTFRRLVLQNFNDACCVSGLDVAERLICKARDGVVYVNLAACSHELAYLSQHRVAARLADLDQREKIAPAFICGVDVTNCACLEFAAIAAIKNCHVSSPPVSYGIDARICV